MKDFDTWFYVIAFVFYIIAQIYRGYKKTKAAPPPPKTSRQPRRTGDQVPVPVEVHTKPVRKKSKKRFSFDDLLKEFEESFAEEKRPEPVRESPEKYEKEVFKGYSETESYETENVRTEQPPIKGLETLESTMDTKPGKTELEFTRSEDYKIQKNVENPYAKILREPDGLKKAIILSEILNRKYF